MTEDLSAEMVLPFLFLYSANICKFNIIKLLQSTKFKYFTIVRASSFFPWTVFQPLDKENVSFNFWFWQDLNNIINKFITELRKRGWKNHSTREDYFLSEFWNLFFSTVGKGNRFESRFIHLKLWLKLVFSLNSSIRPSCGMDWK